MHRLLHFLQRIASEHLKETVGDQLYPGQDGEKIAENI